MLKYLVSTVLILLPFFAFSQQETPIPDANNKYGSIERDAVLPAAIIIQEIKLEGNKRTKSRIILRELTSHEGDFEALSEARRTFGDIGLNIVAFDDISKLVETVYGVAKEGGIDPKEAGAHAGEFETSLMLAAFPEKVRMSRVEEGLTLDLTEQPDFFRQDLRKVAPNGIIGDPRRASAEQGERYWQALTNIVLQQIKRR